MTIPKEINSNLDAERRRATRSRCLREARCVFNKGGSDFTALVRNISATGAKLTGNALYRLPDEFDLQMSNGPGDGAARRVRRVWSQIDSIGVVFLEPERQTTGPLIGAKATKRSPVETD